MSSWRVVGSRLAGLVTGRRRADELSAEIDQHLELLTEDYVRRGLSPSAAADAARRAFGGVQRIRSLHREQAGFAFVDAFVHDLRFALRLLTRNPGFALTAVLVLGFGIGVNNMMFTLIYGITMRGLPIDRPERVLYISTFDQRAPDRPLSYPEVLDLRTQATSLQSLAAFATTPVVVGGRDHAPDRFEGTFVSAGAFELVGTAPALGRSFTADDDRPGAEPVAILGAVAWRTRYAADPAVLGRSILIDGSPATIIGIMPEPSRFPSTAEVWLPLARLPGLDVPNRAARQLRVIARLRDGVAFTDARAEIESIVSRGALAHPGTSAGLEARVIPIHDRFFGDPTQITWLAFSAAAILVLVITCANAATVMLARAGMRARELAVRGSLGATRRRVIYQLLAESAVIAGLAGTVGLAVSWIAVRIFRTAVPEGMLPYWTHFEMDARIFAALVITSFATVLIFGLVPAVQASKIDVNQVLKDGGRNTGRGGVGRLTTAFLVAEFALTVVLLTPLVESYQGSDRTPPSDEVVDTPEVITASITLPTTKYRNPGERLAFFDQLGERLAGTGLADAFTVASALPRNGAVEQRFELEAHSGGDAAQAPAARIVVVGRDYFKTLALATTAGREFWAPDGSPGQEAAIVNEVFVAVHFPGVNPIGQRIRVFDPGSKDASGSVMSIIGVAPDIRQRSLLTTDPVIYLPYRARTPATVSLLVRSPHDPADVAALLRREVAAIDPNLPLYRVMTLAKVIEDAQWNGRVSHRLITTLTLIALGVSLVGLHAVTIHTVTQRTQEIGIRMAMGADGADVCRLVLRRAVVQVSGGLALGVAGSAVWTSIFGWSGADGALLRPSVLVPVCAVLATVTLAACIVPIRRATRLDPVVALRQE